MMEKIYIFRIRKLSLSYFWLEQDQVNNARVVNTWLDFGLSSAIFMKSFLYKDKKA